MSATDFLGPDESWEAPSGRVDFVALSMWKLKGGAKDALGDIGSIGAGADGSLWLLSDKSQRVARPGEHVEPVVADPIPKDRWVRA